MARMSESPYVDGKEVGDEEMDCFTFMEQNHSGVFLLEDDDELSPYKEIIDSLCGGVDLAEFAVEDGAFW